MKISKSDQPAFRFIYDHYRNKIYSYSLKILGSEVAAEEIVQDVFLNIWLNREGLNQIQNFGGYLRNLSRNYAVNALRKNAREAIAFANKNKDWLDIDIDTENYINYKDVHKLLNNALDTLPPQQRLVYTLCKIDGMRQKEVAQQLNITVQTVKSHLKLASQSIKASILMDNFFMLFLLFMSANQHFVK